VRFLIAVLLVVAVAWGWTHLRHRAMERDLAAVASELAGRPVGVDCQGFFSELLDIQNRAGEVQFPNGRAPEQTFLTRSVCGRLRDFMHSGSHDELDCLRSVDWSRGTPSPDDECARGARSTAEAVNTLAHESMHLRGFTNEAQAQCYAIQLDAWTVVRLGGTAAEGADVASLVLALQPYVPDEYRSSDCRSGGSLDLWPKTAAFPSEDPPQLPPRTLVGPAAG
jgi:hypothetical protein